MRKVEAALERRFDIGLGQAAEYVLAVNAEVAGQGVGRRWLRGRRGLASAGAGVCAWAVLSISPAPRMAALQITRDLNDMLFLLGCGANEQSSSGVSTRCAK